MKNYFVPLFLVAIMLTSCLVGCTKDVPVVNSNPYTNSRNTSTVAITKTRNPLPIGPLDTIVVKTNP